MYCDYVISATVFSLAKSLFPVCLVTGTEGKVILANYKPISRFADTKDTSFHRV